MEQVDLEKVLRERNANGSRHDWRCPGETQLAAYVDQTLDAKARALLETHLAACSACIEQVAFLQRASDWPESGQVPIQLLIRARSLVPEKRKTSLVWNWRWVPVTVAALLIVVFGLFAWRALRSRTSPVTNEPLVAQNEPAQQPLAIPSASRPATNTSSPPIARHREPSPQSAAPLVRNGEPASQSPKLIFPTEGATIKRAAVPIRWEAVSSATYYDVSIKSVSGDTIFEGRTSEAHLSIPPERLTSAGKYFATVRAHFSDGSATKPNLVSFKIVD